MKKKKYFTVIIYYYTFENEKKKKTGKRNKDLLFFFFSTNLLLILLFIIWHFFKLPWSIIVIDSRSIVHGISTVNMQSQWRKYLWHARTSTGKKKRKIFRYYRTKEIK